ncbi:hypothetical protein [Enterococcus sp.]|uniref:hypothetical protein n=1 Tax=Enterococcus sp. TaxID=35783 RepID=UPI00289A9A68|nr:hypothetical protein [Enterococcus sp.]
MFNHKQQKGEGNAKRKSNRYSILMLALIFIGFATYGTYAYFTDSTSVGSEIKLSTGTVSLANDSKSDEWEYGHIASYSENKQISNKKGNSFSNAQPGDTFTLTKTVQYTGTLDAKVFYTVSQDLQDQLKISGMSMNIEVLSGKDQATATNISGNKFAIYRDEYIFISIVITIDPQSAEKYGDSTGRNMVSNSFDLSKASEAINITVEQNTNN